MNELNVFNLTATTIPDAWFRLVWALVDGQHRQYKIDQGSYVGDQRLEFDYVTVQITHPQVRPLEPDMPVGCNIPAPVEPGYIDNYLPYLMTAEKQPGEDYTYGSRMFGDMNNGNAVSNQVEYFIDMLVDTPNTNQAILQIGQPGDCFKESPPCLRHIDMRIQDGRLIFYPYFRSWDLWGGFPANLGGLVHLQEYMSNEIGVSPGPFICSSKGLHLYKYVWELAEYRTGRKMQANGGAVPED